MTLLDLGGMLLLGLVGSAHCVGMCGGFVLCLAGGRRPAAWQAGRAVSYAMLGAGLALLGLTARTAWQGGGGRVAMGVAGLVMVVVGLGFLGVLPHGSAWSPLRGRLGGLLARGTLKSSFLLGAATALLPCGLLYAALARAAASSGPAEGAALMLAFWLGSSPGLWAVGGLAPWIRRVGPAWWPRLAGACTLLMGLAMAWRALQGTCCH